MVQKRRSLSLMVLLMSRGRHRMLMQAFLNVFVPGSYAGIVRQKRKLISYRIICMSQSDTESPNISRTNTFTCASVVQLESNWGNNLFIGPLCIRIRCVWDVNLHHRRPMGYRAISFSLHTQVFLKIIAILTLHQWKSRVWTHWS